MQTSHIKVNRPIRLLDVDPSLNAVQHVTKLLDTELDIQVVGLAANAE
jgi:hypothetical protein